MKEEIDPQARIGYALSMADEYLTPKDRKIKGRATYQGKSYWMIAQRRDPKTGLNALLAPLEGGRLFWARGPTLSIDKLFPALTSMEEQGA